MATVPPPPFAGTRYMWELGSTPWLDPWGAPAARARVVIDNDFAGDPDDLLQLVHHLLSPTVDVELIVASHLRVADLGARTSARDGAAVVLNIFERMGLTSTHIVVAGAEEPLADHLTPQRSEATDRIREVALRDDSRPLYYVAGGSLTDVASALLAHPEIAARMTLVWIGGFEHADRPPSLKLADEYNLSMDVAAARAVFDSASLALWQVPRNVYGTCVMSDAEMILSLAAAGPLGEHLRDEVRAEMLRFAGAGRAPSEAYVMGDSPLVLLTALTDYWSGGTPSSAYDVKPTPALLDDGWYRERASSRPMRLYTSVDMRLIVADLAAKLALFEQWQRS